ncbi:hypothetical protein AMS68_002745 [Peltaster fructicola]|uniref:Uncharacterized protein n=1 Tax=Peltaster fructicola TaxID=286661 RepID=A0A6H0XRF9_9PEZI|nr:hypothetical protein AMS68_002745 [Peltaster fructicola]
MRRATKNNHKPAKPAKQVQQVQQAQEVRDAKAMPATTRIDHKHHCELCRHAIKAACIKNGHMFICGGIPEGWDGIDRIDDTKYENAEWHCWGGEVPSYTKRKVDFCVGCREKFKMEGKKNAAEKQAKRDQEAADKEAEELAEWGIKQKSKKGKGKTEK